MNAVDTNVLVYALDDDVPLKQAKANELLERLAHHPSETLLLWQVAAEFLAVLRRWQDTGKVTADDVTADFADLRRMFPLRRPNARVFKACFDLRARFSLSHWDSLLIAACKDARVDRLYSEDMESGADYDGVRIEDPFA